MATTNSTDDPRKNGAKTLVWRMQRGHHEAYAEAVRRVLNGCKHPKSETLLVDAGACFEDKNPDCVNLPAMPSPTEVPVKDSAPKVVATLPIIVEDSIPQGFTWEWLDEDQIRLIPA